jgi:Tfp pilus assembly protein PilF
VSLISEALKEAQRTRSARTTPRGPAALGDSFFPYPSDRKHRAPRRAFVIGGFLGVILLIGAATVARVITARTPKRGVNAVAAPSVSTPTPAPTPISAAPPNVPAAATNTPITVPPKAAPAASTPRQVAVIPTPSTVEPVATAKPQEIASALPPKPAVTRDSAVVVPPKIQQIQPAAADVRVVVDPPSLRPGDSLFARAYAEHIAGNLEGAADLYAKAILKPPVSPELYNNYGALLAAQKNFNAAIYMYRRGLVINDADAKLWTNLADAFRETGKHAEAMGAYEQAGKLDPMNVVLKMRLAAEYQAFGDTSSARRGYEDAVRTAPKDPEPHYAYAGFLQSQKDYRGAVRELQQFIDFAPGRYAKDQIDKVRTVMTSLRKQYP